VGTCRAVSLLFNDVYIIVSVVPHHPNCLLLLLWRRPNTADLRFAVGQSGTVTCFSECSAVPGQCQKSSARSIPTFILYCLLSERRVGETKEPTDKSTALTSVSANALIFTQLLSGLRFLLRLALHSWVGRDHLL